MDHIFLGLAAASLIVIAGIDLQVLKEAREMRRQLKTIAMLTRDTRSREGSIGIHRSNGGATPQVERAKQVGPRTDIPATGRMRQGLKFERKGGEYERNRDDEGD